LLGGGVCERVLRWAKVVLDRKNKAPGLRGQGAFPRGQWHHGSWHEAVIRNNRKLLGFLFPVYTNFGIIETPGKKLTALELESAIPRHLSRREMAIQSSIIIIESGGIGTILANATSRIIASLRLNSLNVKTPLPKPWDEVS
jgi:hypothetical protein